jgi:glycosyltransferase involved in cell wall biosynthesis
MQSADPQSRSLTILVPVHNEENTIRPFLDELYEKCLSRLSDYEVIMVEDGSKDNTREVLAVCEKTYDHFRALTSEARIGYAECVKLGVAQATKDWILLMDGDGQIEPEDVFLLLKQPLEYDIVAGEKFPRCDPWFRIIVSRWFDVVTDTILGISLRDINFGLKLMRAGVAKKLAPQCGKLGEIFTAELVIRFIYAGQRLQQLRVRHRGRMRGTVSTGIPPGKIITKSWRAFRGLVELQKELTSPDGNTHSA